METGKEVSITQIKKEISIADLPKRKDSAPKSV